MGAAWVDVFRWSANISPSNATGVRGSAYALREPRRFGALNRVLRFCRGPANVRKHDDLHQSGYSNYQLHYLGSGLHFSCPNPKRAADGSSSRRLFEKNGLRLFCVVLCGAGILPDVFRLPSYGFPTVFCLSLPFFPSIVRLRGRSSTTRAAPPSGNAAGKERQGK